MKLAAALLLSCCWVSGSFAEPISAKLVESANPAQVKLAYKRYTQSINASELEALNESLQRSLDRNPVPLLTIKGIKASWFCNGGSIAMDYEPDFAMALNSVNLRISKVKKADIPEKIKADCLDSLEKYKAKAQHFKTQ